MTAWLVLVVSYTSPAKVQVGPWSCFQVLSQEEALPAYSVAVGVPVLVVWPVHDNTIYNNSI